MDEINLIVKARKRINDMLMGRNNIDKLFTESVNPYILVEEQPLPVQIGKYIIFVGNRTLEKNYECWNGWARILAMLQTQTLNFDLLSDGGELYKAINLNKKLYKELCKLLHRTVCKQQSYYLDKNNKERKPLRWNNVSLRYLIKNITIEKLIQMCFLVYLYNFDAVKKNSEVISFRLPAEGKQTMETYMAFWLQNLVGLTGKYLLAQMLSPDLLQEELASGMELVSEMGLSSEKKVANG
jgi:hypothetical protein